MDRSHAATGAVTSLFKVLVNRAEETPDAVAAIDAIPGHHHAPTQVTYRQLRDYAEKLAGALAGLGAGLAPEAGDVLGIYMRRGTDWYCLFCAAMRLRLPVVCFSTDLPDKSAELQRNQQILEDHPLKLLIKGVNDVAIDLTRRNVGVLEFASLWAASYDSPSPLPSLPDSADPANLLCYCYTGGTTKASRCAEITHGMALHEVEAYPRVATLSQGDKVMQQHSLYWAASAFGEVDIALAFGCTLLFCEAWGADSAAALMREHGVACAGLVPSILAAVDASDVPSLKLVFTWGEALQPAVAKEWAKKVHLIDLLISTECWLSLYADWTDFTRQREGIGAAAASSERAPFKVVPGALVDLRQENSELLLAGPMVTPRYTDELLNKSSFLEVGGRRWFCTHDCAEEVEEGSKTYRFTGRADDLIKVGGEWVDVSEVEQELQATDGVREVRIVQRDAFCVVEHVRPGTLARLRSLLPPEFALFLVPALPRRPGTDKVDRQRLVNTIRAVDERSVKLEADARSTQLKDLLWWYLPAGGTFLVGAVVRRGLSLLAAAAFPRVAALQAGPFQLLHTARGLTVRSLCLSFMALSTLYLPSDWYPYYKPIPFGLYGLIVGAASFMPLQGVLLASLPGVFKASRRGRALSWPVVCGCGFPLWCRASGESWWKHGLKGALKYYGYELDTRMKKRLLGMMSRPYWPLVEKVWSALRGQKYCFFCKDWRSEEGGGLDSEDLEWYCKECWAMYDAHRECSRCNEWSHRGEENEDGNWVCRPCLRSAAREAADAAADAAAPPESVGSPAATAPEEVQEAEGTEAASEAPSPAGGVASAGPGESIIPVNAHDSASLEPSAEAQAPEPELPPPGAPAPAAAAAGGMPSPVHQLPHYQSISWQTLRESTAAEGDHEELQTSSISLPPPEDTPELAEGAPGVEAEQAGTQSKTPEWRVVEESTGLIFASRNDALLSLDSLRVTKMLSALRRELGVKLSMNIVRQCPTLDALLQQISAAAAAAAAQSAAQEEQSSTSERRKEYKAWGMMWLSKCEWLLVRDGELDEGVLRQALVALMARHPVLRTQLADPMPIFASVQQAFTCFELFDEAAARKASSSTSPLASFGQWCTSTASSLVRKSFHSAWGRVRCTDTPAAEDVPLQVFSCADSYYDARYQAWDVDFDAPPFQVLFMPFKVKNAPPAAPEQASQPDPPCEETVAADDARSECASVSAAGDADSDAAASHADDKSRSSSEEAEEEQGSSQEDEGQDEQLSVSKQEEEAAADGRRTLLIIRVTHMLSDGFTIVPLLNDLAYFVAHAEGTQGLRQLPYLPNVFELLEQRLFRTVMGDNSRADSITREELEKRRFDARKRYLTLEAEVVLAIRRMADTLTVTPEVLILTVIAISIAWLKDQFVVPLCLIVPQRDGPAEPEMVGFFADCRQLDVNTYGLSYAGVALMLQDRVKKRQWHVPPVMTNYEATAVNFEWTDFDSKFGFQQQVHLRGGTMERVQNKIKISIDEPDKDTWRLRLCFAQLYHEGLLDQFCKQQFRQALWSLLTKPLELVWKESQL